MLEWSSKRSSRYELGARPSSAVDMLRVLALACVDSPAVLGRPNATSAPLLGGRLGVPGGEGPAALALE